MKYLTIGYSLVRVRLFSMEVSALLLERFGRAVQWLSNPTATTSFITPAKL